MKRRLICIWSFVFLCICGLSVRLQSFEENQAQSQTTSSSTQSARVAIWSDEVLGRELHGILDLETPVAARELLLLARRELHPRVETHPLEAFQVILDYVKA